jgi:predicted RNA-binding protein with PUA-like domain
MNDELLRVIVHTAYCIVMNYWLLKSDPEEYGFDDLVKDGKAVWDGVTNNLALQNLRKIKKGDVILIYHTGDEKALAGLATAISNPYPDPKADNEKLAVIDLKPKKRVKRALTLSEIKALPEFSEFQLVKLPRLSVMPVSVAEYQRLAELAGL